MEGASRLQTDFTNLNEMVEVAPKALGCLIVREGGKEAEGRSSPADRDDHPGLDAESLEDKSEI